MARKVKNDDKGFGDNPADGFVIIDGERISRPMNKTMSKTAMKGKDDSMRKQAMLAALRKKRSKNIPASPTK